MTDQGRVAYQDQAAAAATQAGLFMQRLVGPLHADRLIHQPPGQEFPPWVQRVVDAANAELAAGRAIRCQHLQAGPRPVIIAAWAPHIHHCADCFDHTPNVVKDMLDLRNEIECWTCDLCRKYKPGQVTLCVGQTAQYMFWTGLCTTCRPATS